MKTFDDTSFLRIYCFLDSTGDRDRHSIDRISTSTAYEIILRKEIDGKVHVHETDEESVEVKHENEKNK